MKDDLKKLGLTEGEAKAYIALLKAGTSTVGPIAKEAGISYSKIYEVLERLIEKGLVSFVTREKTKHFQAIAPNRLADFLEKKEKEINDNKELLKRLLPGLEKMRGLAPKEESEIFLGTAGLKTAYDLLLENNKDKDFLLFFYVYDEQYQEIASSFYQKEFVYYKKLGIRMRGISTIDFKKSKYFEIPPSFVELKFVDFPLPSLIDIYQDKVLFTAWRDKPVAYLIHSKEIADNLRKYFEAIWKMAKS